MTGKRVVFTGGTGKAFGCLGVAALDVGGCAEAALAMVDGVPTAALAMCTAATAFGLMSAQ